MSPLLPSFLPFLLSASIKSPLLSLCKSVIMKSRGEEQEEEEEEPIADDGLEVISIGSLYRGRWEKKYWSCSRGKNRYPYPVGYHAVRFHDGNGFEMEIHEGSIGPLFEITTAHGHSCSGPTPNVAWEKFQKKGVPRKKIRHDKRFSCKIDGVELFGFKDQVVQRFLRELVADLHRSAGCSLLSPTYCNGAAVAEMESECTDLRAYQNSSAFLPKPLTTGNISQKHEKIVNESERAASPERLKTEMQNDIEVISSSRKRRRNSKNTEIMDFPASKEVVLKEFQGTLPRKACPSHVLEACELLKAAGEGLTPSNSDDVCSLVREAATSEGNKQEHPEICRSITITDNISLDRLCIEEMDPLNSSVLMESIDEEAAIVEDSEDITDSDAVLIVDDTPDELSEDEPTAAHTNWNEGFVSESHPKELDTQYSGGSSEKSEFDSVGQEIAQSMMAVLLPQALPLLRRGSRKKRERKGRTCLVQNPPNNSKLQENDNIDSLVNVSSPSAVNGKKVPAQDADVDIAAKNIEHAYSAAAPEGSGNHQHTPQADYWDSLDDQDILDFIETSEMANIVYHDKQHAPFDEKLRENDSNASGQLLPQNFQRHELISERSGFLYAGLNSDPKSFGIHHEEQGFKIASINSEAHGVNDANAQNAKADDETGDAGNGNCSHIPSARLLSRMCEAPLSESTVHRNSGNNYLRERCPIDGHLMACETCEVCSNEQPNYSRSNADESLLDGQRNVSCRKYSTANGKLKLNGVPVVSENEVSIYTSSDRGTSGSIVPSVSNVEKSQSCVHMGLDVKKDIVKLNNCLLYQTPTRGFPDITSSAAKEDQVVSQRLDGHVKAYTELKGILQFVGCYSHPLPTLSVLLGRYGSVIYLCVQCGLLVDEVRTLFLYKLLTEEPRIGCPSFIGQTSLLPPISKPSFGGITLERTWFQMTPDGQRLILLGNAKTPYCRERRISCSCSTCASVCLDDYAIRIVQVNIGYVTIVLNLKSVDRILSVLVCEPNRLVATGESGGLHLWIMNRTWSVQLEEFDLPAYGCFSPCIVELKKVPKHASLLVGSNGFGEFTVWDISRRISVAKFTALSTIVHRFLPISSFSLRWKDTASSRSNVDEHINEIMAATTRTFQESDGSHPSLHLQLEGGELALWLLVSAVSDAEDDCLRNASEVNSVAWWRLALLAKNAMILGSPLDPRAVAIAALSGHGVIGTRDGIVYLWDLSTGNKLGTLHHFIEGNGISCIATDDSTSSILAVCGNNGEVMVYQQPHGGSAD
ncbi:uncharacterized protein LOC116192300 isoform X2 [Punica granatum]|uniref:Uncharacterized protein LOC116192300 isoform X2 n=1 Tax=Punica granatum TaxID=22663 RepID=A0A6P8C5T0_PUNGR|nr:uncharacterized protein LOC116192300 isoform X2 [Punica granatum]